jgi:tRNA (guanine-N7-)-methyltransferase
VGLARLDKARNFVGVDIKGVRMWTGAQTALEEGLDNVAFLRADIHAIGQYFGDGEVDGIWITFPDPFPKLKQTKNRMTNERFLKQYARMLKPGGQVWFKTDNNSLFEYTLMHFEELNEKEVFKIHLLEVTRDLRASEFAQADHGITTDYERRFMKMGKKINYVRFTVEAGPNIGMIPATDRVSLDANERAPRLR